MIHTVSVWWLTWLRPLIYLWIAATGTTAYAQTTSTTPTELHSLVGRIEGLVNHGLALSDGAGNVIHPSAGARAFAFREGRPSLTVSRPTSGRWCRLDPFSIPTTRRSKCYAGFPVRGITLPDTQASR